MEKEGETLLLALIERRNALYLIALAVIYPSLQKAYNVKRGTYAPPQFPRTELTLSDWKVVVNTAL